MAFVILFICVGLIFAAATVLAVYSVQSLRQANVLQHPIPLSRLKEHIDRDVSVWGRPEIERGRRGPTGFPLLWYKCVVQEYRRWGRTSGWFTVSRNVRHYPFFLHFADGGRVYVSGLPTEVHGTLSSTEGGGFFAFHGSRRTTHTWLPAETEVVALGKLGLSKQGATLMPSKKLGLLLASGDPKSAARMEKLKGFAGLGVCAMVFLGGIALLIGVVV